MNRLIGRFLAVCVAAVSLVSGCRCGHEGPEETGTGKVMILWSNGFNNLSHYLEDDIKDLHKGYLPAKDDRDVVLVVSHLTDSRGDYVTKTSPQLIRIYKDRKTRKAVMDTLKSYSSGTYLGRASTMKDILGDIHRQFNAEHYGMIFSSHATGWLPAGYYSNPQKYDSKTQKPSSAGERLPEGAVPYTEEQRQPGEPDVKSFGATTVTESHVSYSYETDLTDLAETLPFHMDYLIFDACLAGGVEVAYELRSSADMICFSPAEVLAEGLDYTRVAGHLLSKDTPDVKAVAEDYYEQYACITDPAGRAATVTVIDTRKMSRLAEVCGRLFGKYRTEMAGLDPTRVQRYYRSYHHWYYDLEDILLKAGISAAEQAELESALEECITYKASTEAFLEKYGGFTIDMYSGLSMYLPCDGSAYLDAFYRKLAWNKAAELVD